MACCKPRPRGHQTCGNARLPRSSDAVSPCAGEKIEVMCDGESWNKEQRQKVVFLFDWGRGPASTRSSDRTRAVRFGKDGNPSIPPHTDSIYSSNRHAVTRDKVVDMRRPGALLSKDAVAS